MTPTEQARALAKTLRDTVMRAPADIDAAEAMEIPLTAALAQARQEIWEKAAQLIEKPVNDPFNCHAEVLRRLATRCREQAKGESDVTS